MLGRLQMDVDECILAYTELCDTVFRKTRHRIKVNGTVQARFDTATLERAIKDIIASKLQEDELLKDSTSRCRVWVACHLRYAVDHV